MRSRHTWAVVAALLVPSATCITDPIPLKRSEIAERFWGGLSEDPANCLRQTIHLLKRIFGSENIVAQRHTLAIKPGVFKVDVYDLVAIHSELIDGVDEVRRAELLGTADALITGPFVDGCIDISEPGHTWYCSVRHAVEQIAVDLLKQVCTMQIETNDFTAAFYTARRVLAFIPTDPEARTRVWELGQKAKILHLNDILTADEDVEDVMERIASRQRRGIKITGRERKLFDSVLDERITGLSVADRKRLYRLSVLPYAFSQALAYSVGNASRSVLERFYALNLITPSHTDFLMPDLIRESANHRLRATQKLAVQQSLVISCITWLEADAPIPSDGTGMFSSRNSATIALSNAVSFMLTRPLSERTFLLLDLCRAKQYVSVAAAATDFIARSLTADQPLNLRRLSLQWLAAMSRANRKFEEAARLYEQALECCLEYDACHNPFHKCGWQSTASLYGQASMAWHHAGDADRALLYNDSEYNLVTGYSDLLWAASCLRIRSEILSALGRYSEMLECLNQAMRIYHNANPADLTLAECHYLLGTALVKKEHFAEALSSIQISLDIRLQAADISGIGQCLCVLAEIRAQEGNLAEAQAHVLHAISLYENSARHAGKAAAQIILGDIHANQGRTEAARTAYNSALNFWQTENHERWCSICRSKIARLLPAC